MFKPPKSALRLARAVRIVGDLVDLIKVGSVCRDERSGLRRPASPAVWTAGIAQMLSSRGGLSLPLDNHHYLRAVVFGLADQIDAKAEQARESVRRSRAADGPSPERPGESVLESTLGWLRQQHAYDQITDEQYRAAVADAKAKSGVHA